MKKIVITRGRAISLTLLFGFLGQVIASETPGGLSWMEEAVEEGSVVAPTMILNVRDEQIRELDEGEPDTETVDLIEESTRAEGETIGETTTGMGEAVEDKSSGMYPRMILDVRDEQIRELDEGEPDTETVDLIEESTRAEGETIGETTTGMGEAVEDKSSGMYPRMILDVRDEQIRELDEGEPDTEIVDLIEESTRAEGETIGETTTGIGEAVEDKSSGVYPRMILDIRDNN